MWSNSVLYYKLEAVIIIFFLHKVCSVQCWDFLSNVCLVTCVVHVSCSLYNCGGRDDFKSALCSAVLYPTVSWQRLFFNPGLWPEVPCHIYVFFKLLLNTLRLFSKFIFPLIKDTFTQKDCVGRRIDFSLGFQCWVVYVLPQRPRLKAQGSYRVALNRVSSLIFPSRLSPHPG